MHMTAVWVAEHGWCYLNAIIDCCTREIVGWGLEVRCWAVEAIAVVERAVAEQAIPPGTLTLGTDNGSAFTARKRARLQHAGRGPADLGRCPGRTTKSGRLSCQHRRGAVQRARHDDLSVGHRARQA
jgi:Integrase core domain